ncbi:MAG TPA: response regulator [Candidatus Angelobacter sp.]|nr:response regulator [Candidatus Angelobacter sp.]
MPTNILVVDDEPSIVDTVSAIFEAAGYNTSCAYSGEEAIAKARECRPNLLLCDIMMPDLNGFQVALRIKTAFPECRIVFFSAHTPRTKLWLQEFDPEFAGNDYPFDFLAKPINPGLLLQKVQEALQS